MHLSNDLNIIVSKMQYNDDKTHGIFKTFAIKYTKTKDI